MENKCKALKCETELTGSQRDYCSGRCKQAVKYAVKTGRQCKSCWKPTKPTPAMGGYTHLCERKRCIKGRVAQ